MALTKITEGIIADGAVPTTGIVGVSTFTSSGTWTKSTRESALGFTIKRVIVEVQGAGGAGLRSSIGDAQNSGGAGGYAKKLIDVSSISSATITIGSGGAGSTSVNTKGGNGGDSIWSDGTNTITGSGGSAAETASFTYGLGGTATGGDLNFTGQAGAGAGDGGGDSFLGHGGSWQYASSRASELDGKLGGGGSATWHTYPAGVHGGNGGDGIVIVTEIAG